MHTSTTNAGATYWMYEPGCSATECRGECSNRLTACCTSIRFHPSCSTNVPSDLCSLFLQLQCATFVCLRSWVNYCHIPPTLLAGNPLLAACFDALVADELFDDAIDCVVQVVRIYDSSQENQAVVQVVVPRVMNLRVGV